jgi:hypothetical protein
MPSRSSSVSIADLWPEIDSVEGVGDGDATTTAMCGRLHASSSHCLSVVRRKQKGRL